MPNPKIDKAIKAIIKAQKAIKENYNLTVRYAHLEALRNPDVFLTDQYIEPYPQAKYIIIHYEPIKYYFTSFYLVIEIDNPFDYYRLTTSNDQHNLTLKMTLKVNPTQLSTIIQNYHSF